VYNENLSRSYSTTAYLFGNKGGGGVRVKEGRKDDGHLGGKISEGRREANRWNRSFPQHSYIHSIHF
jgi:hypothetical protein